MPKSNQVMPLINLLHAFVSGVATFTLNPSLPAVDIAPKSSADAFKEDSAKLRGDFDRAFGTMKFEVESTCGQSVTPKA